MGSTYNEFGYNEHTTKGAYFFASRWLTEMLKVRLPRKNLLKMYRFFCIFNSLPAGATCDCEKSEGKRWIFKICPKKTKKNHDNGVFLWMSYAESKHKVGKVHFAWTYETCAISFTSCSTPFGLYWHYRVHSRVLTDITGYIYIGSYWDYRVHTQDSYWHYRVHPWHYRVHTSAHWRYRVNLLVLTDITEYTPGSLLTLQGTPLDPYWRYRVHPLVLTDITGYTNWSLLTLQGAPLGSLLTLQGAPLTDITGCTPGSLLTLQGTPTGPYWHYRVHPLGSLLTLQGTPTGPYWHHRVHPLVLTDVTGYTAYWYYRVHPWVLIDITGCTHGPY